MSRLGNLGKQFLVDAIDDFVNVKVSMWDTASWSLSWLWRLPCVYRQQ